MADTEVADTDMIDATPVIKLEPPDDDQTDLFNSHPPASDEAMDNEDEPMFVEEETVLERATDHEGRPFPSVCFERPYLQHPHHHRLVCGHDIMTTNIERCGSNCARTKDRKPGGPPFECPDSTCKRQAKVVRPNAGSSKPRKCTLSHVYGRDPVADQARFDEKSAELSAGMSLRNSQVPQQRMVRKRSQSPPPRAKKNTSTKSAKAKTPAPVDCGELLNRELEKEANPKLITAFTGPGVKLKIGDRFKTDAEIARDVENSIMTRGMSKVQMATKQEQTDRAKNAAKLRADNPPLPDKNAAGYIEADTEPMPIFFIECDNCDQLIHGVRHHCFDCMDFDLCVQCFEEKTYKHSSHHRIKELDKPLADWLESSNNQKESFCVCGSSTTHCLVLCADCQSPFHPGCIGAGHYQKLEYDIDGPFREDCLKHDYVGWKGGEAFRCAPCEKTHVAQKVDEARNARAEERKKRRKMGLSEKPSMFEKATSKKRAASEIDDEDDSTQDEVAAFPQAKRLKFDLPMRPMVRVRPTPAPMMSRPKEREQQE